LLNEKKGQHRQKEVEVVKRGCLELASPFVHRTRTQGDCLSNPAEADSSTPLAVTHLDRAREQRRKEAELHARVDTILLVFPLILKQLRKQEGELFEAQVDE